MIQSEFINDFCDFLYRRNPSGGILRHWNGSQVVRIGSNLKILYVGTFGIQWFKKSLLMIIVTSYSKPVVFWKYALQVRELPGPKLGVWGPLGSGALPESIGIWITFFGGSSSILDRSAQGHGHKTSTEPRKKVGTWLRDISSWPCLAFLPGPAWL